MGQPVLADPDAPSRSHNQQLCPERTPDGRSCRGWSMRADPTGRCYKHTDLISEAERHEAAAKGGRQSALQDMPDPVYTTPEQRRKCRERWTGQVHRGELSVDRATFGLKALDSERQEQHDEESRKIQRASLAIGHSVMVNLAPVFASLRAEDMNIRKQVQVAAPRSLVSAQPALTSGLQTELPASSPRRRGRPRIGAGVKPSDG